MLDSSAHVGLVPIDDGGDDQVEARCAILLGFMAAINDAPLPECVDRLRQCMALLAVVEAGMATPAQGGVFKPVEHEQDGKSTSLNSIHSCATRMPSSA